MLASLRLVLLRLPHRPLYGNDQSLSDVRHELPDLFEGHLDLDPCVLGPCPLVHSFVPLAGAAHVPALDISVHDVSALHHAAELS